MGPIAGRVEENDEGKVRDSVEIKSSDGAQTQSKVYHFVDSTEPLARPENNYQHGIHCVGVFPIELGHITVRCVLLVIRGLVAPIRDVDYPICIILAKYTFIMEIQHGHRDGGNPADCVGG